jgi:hypothetical protein
MAFGSIWQIYVAKEKFNYFEFKPDRIDMKKTVSGSMKYSYLVEKCKSPDTLPLGTTKPYFEAKPFWH